MELTLTQTAEVVVDLIRMGKRELKVAISFFCTSDIQNRD